MRHTLSYLFFVLVTAFPNFSCNKLPCTCDFNEVRFIEVKFVNQQGQNLLFGPSPLYQFDSLQILNEKHNLNISNVSVQRSMTDSSAALLFFGKVDAKSFIYYNNSASEDSIEITWIKKTGKCCGGPQDYNFIDSVRINKNVLFPVNGIYTFVK